MRHGIILFIINKIHTEGQFRAVTPQKWNFRSMLWIEAGEHKYGPKFIAISNVLKFPLNGKSNNYLHGEVMRTLTELFVDSLRDILRPGTVYQQRLEQACIFKDMCEAFVYLPPSTAEKYTANKYCQVGKKKSQYQQLQLCPQQALGKQESQCNYSLNHHQPRSAHYMTGTKKSKEQ